jgi:D-glycero-alpha-D-manno-heptose 1-phosphate guanylyltransferase
VAMALRPVVDRARYGSVEVAEGRVRRFLEKGAEGPGLINAGVYVLRRDLPARWPQAGAFSLEREVLQAGLGRLAIAGLAMEAPFIDIGIPEDFARAQTLLPEWAAASCRSG